MGSSAKIGYTRVSTLDQKTARQLVGITLDRVFEEKASGRNVDGRPVLKEMLDYIRDGDELYVHSMDRLARNLADLLRLVTTITEKGVTLHFVKENLVFEAKEKASPFNQLMLGLLGAVSQFERELILERQREGVALAKARGAYKGRKRKVTKTLIEQAKEKIAAGQSATAVAAELGIARSSLYRGMGEAGLCMARTVISRTEAR